MPRQYLAPSHDLAKIAWRVPTNLSQPKRSLGISSHGGWLKPLRPKGVPAPTAAKSRRECREESPIRLPLLRGHHRRFNVPDDFEDTFETAKDIAAASAHWNKLGHRPASLR